MSAASVRETREAIDRALRARGGVYTTYSCKEISWDDVSRGTVSGGVSCWGSNITDTYLKSKDGTSLFTVRPDNWNERLGSVRASEVSLLVGNCDDNDVSAVHPASLRSITLDEFLQDVYKNGAAYSGVPKDTDLSIRELDDKVSIRFQTVFLPVSDETRSTLEFASEAYNYNTDSDEHPRNLVILCTTQGIAVQSDGKGQKRLLHHARKKAGGPVHNFWLEAERSDHDVGRAQEETEDERQDALNRGKAIANSIGIHASGTRFNVLMTIQIPLITPQRKSATTLPFVMYSSTNYFAQTSTPTGHPLAAAASAAPMAATFGPPLFGASSAPVSHKGYFKHGKLLNVGRDQDGDGERERGRDSPRVRDPHGVSNAARVSRGSDAGLFNLLAFEKVERKKDEHVTVTVVIYNTVAGGVPGSLDVIAAIDDMEELLEKCGTAGRLSEGAFDFMKKPLAVDDIDDAVTKLQTQPRGSVDGSIDGGVAQQRTDSKCITQKERDGMELCLVELVESPSEQTIVKTRLLAMGALRNASRTVIDALKTELDKLESLRKDKGVSEIAFKNQLTMVVLMIRGALGDHYV